MKIEKVAVIGAGVMGASIAAHIANAGVHVDLLDIVPKQVENRNTMAEAAVAKLLKTEPQPFMHAKNPRLITPGNIEDDLHKLSEVDWVIEAVIEDLSIKQALYQKLATICRPDTLISSNTSTLPLKILTRGFPDSFKRRFMITHFFNPPRYMRLLELVTSPELDRDLLATVSNFADVRLGKGCVLCNDTPGFIANRIGTFWIQTALLKAIDMNLTVEQCDAVITLFGIPKTGVFGLLDLVGLDLMPHILGSFKQTLSPNDRLHQIAEIPPLLQNMITNGHTGRKTLGGFYRLQPGAKQKIKQAIDLHSGAYRSSEKFVIKGISYQADELGAFLTGHEALNVYVWQVLSETLSYTAGLIPEIAADIVAIDTAMRLGYNWRYGPFELLDHLGVSWFVEQLQKDQRSIPELLATRQSLYRVENAQLHFRDKSNVYRPLERLKGVLLLADIKRHSKPLLTNDSASLWDVGDNIACLEFHSKMNTLDTNSLGLIQQSVDLIKKSFKGLVIYNESEHFSAGANLTLLVPAIIDQNWEAVKDIIKLGQDSYQLLKYAPFPVVGAPSGLALGGGCEVLLHCDAIQAHAELYMGLVEVGVGLVPGWGGCKELLWRWQAFRKRPGGPMPFIAQTFETIGLAKVSKSAQEARELLFLSKKDGITMNKDRLLADAKARALELIQDYQVPEPSVYVLPGASAKAALDNVLRNLLLAGKASAYDVEISQQLAQVLTGGNTDVTHTLTEQDLLDLEMTAFLKLVKLPNTLARLQHMLKTGKPLRN